jgi:hypothetical protein
MAGGTGDVFGAILAREDGMGESVIARRLPRARVADVRLGLGLVLVVGSVLAGARLLAVDEPGVLVLRAQRDLAGGTTPSDLTAVRVPPELAGEYVAADAVTGPDLVLRWPVRAGELVPAAALARPSGEPMRVVSVPVEMSALPAGLLAGEVVDVWGTPEDGRPPRLVLAAARVADAPAEATGLSATAAVRLRVPAADVAAVVAAARQGWVDLVVVPADSPDAP